MIITMTKDYSSTQAFIRYSCCFRSLCGFEMGITSSTSSCPINFETKKLPVYIHVLMFVNEPNLKANQI